MAVIKDAVQGQLAATKGATILQLRNPLLTTRQLESEARQLVSNSSLPVLINSRVDVALAVQASGVHLPSSDLSPKQIRPLLPNLMIGKSTHSLVECQKAAAEGAAYVIFGPVFATPSHSWTPGLGIEQLAAAVKSVEIPVLAIGGIDEKRIQACLDVGAAGFAAIRHFLEPVS